MKMIYLHEYDQIEVLKYLDYDNNKWVGIKQIATDLGLSMSAVSKSIVQIKEMIKKLAITEISIDTSTNKGVSFKRSRSYSLHKIIEEIYTESVTFKIIDSIFKGDFHSVEQFSIDMFISVASLKRRIQSLNKIFKNHGFQIKRYEIIGNEMTIRSFMFNFYWEIYRGKSWPFPFVNRVKYDKQSEVLEPKIELWNTNITRTQIYYFLAIGEYRDKRGFLIDDIVSTDIDVLRLSEGNDLFENMVLLNKEHEVKRSFSKLSHRYRYYILNSFSLDYRKSTENGIQNLWQLYCKQNSNSVQIAKKTMEDYRKMSGDRLSEMDFQKSIVDLVMIHHKAHLLSKEVIFRRSDILDELRKYFPNIYTQIEQTIESHLEEFPDVNYNKEIIMEEYAMLIYNSINMGGYSQEIRIALNLSAGYQHEANLEKKLRERFKDKLNLVFVSSQDNHDVLITDGQMKFESSDHSVFIEENRLSEEDYSYINNLFEDFKISG